jgi:DNA-binding transcriptional MerR regulator
MKRNLTIGEVAERAGVTVKTVRFYSDAGLLPPAARSEGNYRLYTLGDVVRVGLIRSLREAGFTIREIRAVLARDLPLAEALRLRLAAVEAQMRALRHVASALRLALRRDPSEDDLRRLFSVTTLSNAERKAAIEQFYAQVAEGIPIHPDWQQKMVEASAPDLPDDPSPEQIEAWIELHGIITDPTFIETARANARQVWTKEFDHEAYAAASNAVMTKARAALERGLSPSSDEAGEIVREWLVGTAAGMKRQPDAAFWREWCARAKRHDPRASRYWELVAILRGSGPDRAQRQTEAWAWVTEAARVHLGGS